MSKTETALAALLAALTAKAGEPGAAIPSPSRNELLPTNFPQFGGVGFWLNLLDGEGEVTQRILGDPDGVVDAYEMVHRAAVELAVEHVSQAARDAAFDGALVALDDMLIADRTLGGAVDWAEIDGVQRTGLVYDGAVGVKAAEVTVALSFTSQRPF